MELASEDLRKERAQKFAHWRANVGRPAPLGHSFRYTPARPLHWTPLAKPLGACTVALVTTAGVHLRSQEPFAVFEPAGDWSFRRIPGDVDTSELTVTHTHYDTRDALADINVIFPLDRLRELAADGLVGRVASMHLAFMGFIPDPARLVAETAPAAAAELARAGVDVALLTAG